MVKKHLKPLMYSVLFITACSVAANADDYYDSLKTQQRLQQLEQYQREQEEYSREQYEALQRARIQRERQANFQQMERSTYQATTSAMQLAPALKGKPFLVLGVIVLCAAAFFIPFGIVMAM